MQRDFVTMSRYSRKFLLIISSLLLSAGISAQSTDTLWNQTDALGQRQGHWKKLNPDGNLIYKGFFKDGKPVGKMVRFYENGKRRAELVYFEGTDITRAKIFYRTGSLAATGKYVNMVKDSVWRYYSYYSDDLMYTETYESGLKHGESRKFYPGGQIAEIMSWQLDIKHGPWKQFFEDSTTRLVSWHDSNQLHGKYQVYNRNRILIMDGEYEHGKMDKTWHFFDDNGKEEHTLQYEKGNLQSSKELEEWAIKHMEEIERNLGTIPEVDINNFFEKRD
jgi:antitoxin component YwqK of YwqJK toxin-antitoxin module